MLRRNPNNSSISKEYFRSIGNHTSIKTSKSPLAVATVAYAVAQASLPKYTSKFSRHTFTLPQLMACLVLKEFFSKDYRGIVGIIADSHDIQSKYIHNFHI